MGHIKKIIVRSIGATAMLLVAVVAGLYSHNDKTKIIFEVDYYDFRRMWPEVIEVVKRSSFHNHFVNNSLNRALCNTGRLGYDKFSYPQKRGSLFLGRIERAFWYKSGIFLDIGHLNIAETSLMIALEEYGERPIILKQLALINMVKGNISAARVFLEAYDKTLFPGKWAKNYLALLDSDPELSSDKYIQELRNRMVKNDSVIGCLVTDFLEDFFESDYMSKMVFDYGMAWYMLSIQLDKFSMNLKRLRDFGYRELPRHYEEAVLMGEYFTGKEVDLHGYEVSEESFKRFEGFIRILNNHKMNRGMAYDKVSEKYSDSYFFYIYRNIWGRRR